MSPGFKNCFNIELFFYFPKCFQNDKAGECKQSKEKNAELLTF